MRGEGEREEGRGGSKNIEGTYEEKKIVCFFRQQTSTLISLWTMCKYQK